MANQNFIAELARNLACRQRLGLSLVTGGASELEELARQLSGNGASRDLEGIRAEIGECTRCELHEKRNKLVFGQGQAGARVMFIGEAPGEKEDQQGVPFVGPAGKLLDRMLAAVGLDREMVYITNIVKCRPPGNRDPKSEEAQTCRPFLMAQVEAVGPRIICTLGRPAAQSILETTAPISALRGNWQTYLGRPLLPTFHPAYLLRSPERKAEAYQDLKTLARALAKGGG